MFQCLGKLTPTPNVQTLLRDPRKPKKKRKKRKSVFNSLWCMTCVYILSTTFPCKWIFHSCMGTVVIYWNHHNHRTMWFFIHKDTLEAWKRSETVSSWNITPTLFSQLKLNFYNLTAHNYKFNLIFYSVFITSSRLKSLIKGC